MKIGTLAAGLAAMTMAVAPVAASAAANGPQRSATPLQGEGMVGENGLVWGLLGAAVLIVGIIIIADSDDDEPVSP